LAHSKKESVGAPKKDVENSRRTPPKLKKISAHPTKIQKFSAHPQEVKKIIGALVGKILWAH